MENGIIIKDYATHFIDRVIGQYSESDTVQTGKRKGVSIDDALDTLLNPIKIGSVRIGKTEDNKSILISGNRCEVSINPDTGTLIQTNPRSSVKKKGK